MSTFGSRLKELRKKSKLTQKDFGKIFKLSESTIGMYERDERKPDYEILIDIADYFEVSTDYLLRGEDYRSQAKEILNNPDIQYAARDGEISESEALDRIARILEKQKGRVPGQRQQRPKRN